MTEDHDDTRPGASGLFGVTRFIAAIAIFLLAGLAVLVVLDVIPAEVFGEFATRVLLVAIIVGLASAAIALLSRSGRY